MRSVFTPDFGFGRAAQKKISTCLFNCKPNEKKKKEFPYGTDSLLSKKKSLQRAERGAGRFTTWRTNQEPTGLKIVLDSLQGASV